MKPGRKIRDLIQAQRAQIAEQAAEIDLLRRETGRFKSAVSLLYANKHLSTLQVMALSEEPMELITSYPSVVHDEVIPIDLCKKMSGILRAIRTPR